MVRSSHGNGLPCFAILHLTAYHVVFGYRFGLRTGTQQEAEQDVSATFSVGGKRSRAVPAKYGQFSRFPGRDWALLRLEPDAGHRCLGEDPNIGWVRLTPLAPPIATKKSLSVAGYPAIRFLRRYGGRTNVISLNYTTISTTTVCGRPTARPGREPPDLRFFVEDGVLNVVAVMSGHLGTAAHNEILPKWDPSRANLALDICKIIHRIAIS
jgi:hypothetical protein